ncbi:hypothetical protein SFRURICE_013269, partial [Spodoptera frugiperda]
MLPYRDTRFAPTEQCSILVTVYTRRIKTSRIAVPLTMACSKKPSYVCYPTIEERCTREST